MNSQIKVNQKCQVNDGEALRVATVTNVNEQEQTYDVTIDGLGTRMSNIPASIWRPVGMAMDELKATIEKLNRHFVDELLNHNYLVKDMDPYTVKILTVSGKHFTLWISNDAEHLSCYGHGRGAYFMELSFTEEEKTTIYARFKQLWNDKQQVPAEIERRRKEYEKLKAEFEPS